MSGKSQFLGFEYEASQETDFRVQGVVGR